MFKPGVFQLRVASIILGILCISITSLCPAFQKAPNPSEEIGPSSRQTSGDTRSGRFKNTLKWSTASELNNFGYDVYRSENRKGPFKRITKQPIPGAGTTDSPHYYEFVDDTIDPRKTYYYYIESISMGGVREKFTPTREAPPKQPKGPTVPKAN